jgi:putative transposase
MPRRPRHYLPDVPCHIIQRGNNRQPCFFRERDYVSYLHWLGDSALKYGCAIHSYVLMTNHVHLLVTPRDCEGISRMMQSLGRRYVRYVNSTQARTGTLWEGRHKASLVESERYLLTCFRYIELNPVRAGLADSPSSYRWSSFRANALGHADPVIQQHPIYLALDDADAARRNAYLELFRDPLEDAEIELIRQTANLSVPLGGASFRAEIDRRLKAPVSYRAPGRPAVKRLATALKMEIDSDPFSDRQVGAGN